MSFLEWVRNNAISIMALVISISSIVFIFLVLKIEHEHNKKGVKPICSIRINDFENKIAVHVCNFGVGPMIIDRIECSNGKERSDSFLALIPSISSFNTYIGACGGRSVDVNGKVTLIQFTNMNREERDRIRNVLKDITVTIYYKDIYDDEFSTDRRLDFLGRYDQRDKRIVFG